MFNGLFDTSLTSVIEPGDFLLCVGASLAVGFILALCYMFRSKYTSSFVITLATLPSVVCVVIMMVNGNIGAGVAVAGAFSLVRFRSIPGTAREIVMLFIAMGSGLVAGMGYIAYAILFALILGLVNLLLTLSGFGAKKKNALNKVFKITIPEELDYTGVFEGVFSDYTVSHELIGVKSTNMGSMFKLTYNVELKKDANEKELIDRLRERNGNLEIVVSKAELPEMQL